MCVNKCYFLSEMRASRCVWSGGKVSILEEKLAVARSGWPADSHGQNGKVKEVTASC